MCGGDESVKENRRNQVTGLILGDPACIRAVVDYYTAPLNTRQTEITQKTTGYINKM